MHPIFSFLKVDKVIDGVGSIIKTFFGSKAERDSQASNERVTGLDELKSEFVNQYNWWDSLWNGFNRMVRPAFVCLSIAYLLLAFFDAIAFIKYNETISTIPVFIQTFLGMIIGFFFAGKMIPPKKAEIMKPSQFKALIKRIDTLDEIRQRKKLEKAEQEELDKLLENNVNDDDSKLAG